MPSERPVRPTSPASAPKGGPDEPAVDPAAPRARPGLGLGRRGPRRRHCMNLAVRVSL